MARHKLCDRVEKQNGQPFGTVLEQYLRERGGSPEEIAAAFGCSLPSLMREAAPLGFKIVRRIEREACDAG